MYRPSCVPQHVVYRDIKPENLLVDEHGRVKLCDFGFARYVTGAPDERLTDYVATRWSVLRVVPCVRSCGWHP